MATVPRTRLAVLRDLADAGPMAASVLKDRHGPYAYPCAYKMVADGLVAVDKRTKAFVITDEGRAFLKTWESSE